MLPQERLIEHVRELPDADVVAIADEYDPVSDLLRRESAGQGRPFFSHQAEMPEEISQIGLLWLNAGEWYGLPHRQLQSHYRNVALAAHGIAVEDAIFVFGETWQNGGWQGKGGKAVPALEAVGYNVVHAAKDDADITILQRGDLWSKFQGLREHTTA